MKARRPRGTQDRTRISQLMYRQLERASQIFQLYGFDEIETPLFEHRDLFVHGLGTETDVVSKEMFSVLSPDAASKLQNGEPLKHDQRLVLRPEGTAGAVRAVIENGLLPLGAPPVKLWYIGPMFRAERAQKGRYRQFTQLGAEVFGTSDPLADAELIIMMMRYLVEIGLDPESMTLLINSMGDTDCRVPYQSELANYILAHQDELCAECVNRATTNPLRALDCKNEQCQAVLAAAPKITDFLSEQSRAHYDQVKTYLDEAGVAYVEEPRLVRGLDYYTHTVFEVQIKEGLGSQNAIGGGGRYDGLMKVAGGKDTPALGFALGLERIVLALQDQGVFTDELFAPSLDVFFALTDHQYSSKALELAECLRNDGISCQLDLQERSLKSQFKLADRLNTRLVVILGEDELAQGSVLVRNMQTKEETLVTFEDLPGVVSGEIYSAAFGLDWLLSDDE